MKRRKQKNEKEAEKDTKGGETEVKTGRILSNKNIKRRRLRRKTATHRESKTEKTGRANRRERRRLKRRKIRTTIIKG